MKKFADKRYGSINQFSKAVEEILGKKVELSRYMKEEGGSLPGAEILQALCQLGLDVNWVLTGRVLVPRQVRERDAYVNEEINRLKANITNLSKQNEVLSGKIRLLQDTIKYIQTGRREDEPTVSEPVQLYANAGDVLPNLNRAFIVLDEVPDVEEFRIDKNAD